MKAFLYARVSTGDKGQDVENQLPEMRRAVESREWKLRREYIDNVTASGKKIRDQFDEMLAACDRHEADVIVVWALDRLSREGPLKTMLLLERLQRANVRVLSMREPWLDPNSPTYDLLVPIFAWIAKQERIRLGERVKAGMARVREKGTRIGRPEHGADVVQIVVLRDRGYSLRAIAKRVGVSEASVRRALKSPEMVRQNGAQK